MHGIYRVRSVRVIAPYVIEVSFDDGKKRTVDLEPILYGELYGPLSDPALFAEVTVDPEIATVVWPNGADFDPETLHDWPAHREAFIVQAKEWQHARSV